MKLSRLFTFIPALVVAGMSISQAQQLEQKPLTEIITAATGTPSQDKTWKVPMIAWGGDLQEIEANGGLTTQKGSFFEQKGLSIQLFREDDFRKQVEMYKKGEINFLRGTVGMLNSATELLNQDPATQFELIYLLTRSQGGDALVAKSNIKTAKDLKGATIAVQAYGPHVDYLSTILRSVGLSTKDVNIVWCPDLFEIDEKSHSPMTSFANASVDAAFAIIPDALAATNNGTVGTGAEGSVKGARILLSTKTATNVIYDAYAVRRSFAQENKELVDKFVHSLLLAQEKLAQKMKNNDQQTLTRGAKILLDDSSATDDMAGMYADAAHAGWAENKAFLSGSIGRNLDAVSDKVQEDFVTMGLLSRKVKLHSSLINFDDLKSGLQHTDLNTAPKFNTNKVAKIITERQQQGALDNGELYSFEIYFQPSQNTFSSAQYETEFDKAIELMTIYGGAILTVEGHSDPLGYLKNKYKNKATSVLLQKQKQAALNLSFSRANAVKASLMRYAKDKGTILDESQFGIVGHGIMHPQFQLDSNGDIDKVNAPKNKDEWNRMRRVKFRLMQVEAESDVFEAISF